MKREILALLAACVFASPASAQTDHSVFGIELGKPLSVPECKIIPEPGYGYMYAISQSVTCFERGPSSMFKASVFFAHLDTTPVRNGTVTIHFAKRTEGIHCVEMETLMVDGSVELVTIYTDGVSEEDAVLAALRAKYGEPTVLTPGQAQNLAGATFHTIDAIWKLSDITVNFISELGKVDVGEVEIATSKGLARDKAISDSVNHTRAGPKL